jgi:hypothetical protein
VEKTSYLEIFNYSVWPFIYFNGEQLSNLRRASSNISIMFVTRNRAAILL